ncbi:MAG: RnfABCDGE type electron transport complex subunit B [Gammaproteobacteria bacterium]|nr:RnfABCDGE type electron transport complex subunit B [Gammaproteobacteria bacterium]
MTSLGVALAVLLAIANRKLYVFEDPRIDQVEEMLPRANCGACGSPGCRPFAESLVEGTVDPGLCTVNATEMTQGIADFLGVEVLQREKRVARLACAGGTHVAYYRAKYQGLESCRAADVVSGGGKGCTWGCLGLADCERACEFDAINMDPHGLPVVVEENCVACNGCVEACPKDLFSLQPLSQKLWVACKNLVEGDEAEALCEVACTGCGRCAADAPEGLITIQHNLAIIDHTKIGLASRVAIERCPTGAIVWLDEDHGAVKGVEARKIVRMEPLPRG